MKNKLLIIPMMLILLIGIVSASLTFETPSTNGRMYGTYAVNVTATAGTLKNITNCTITIGSASTANTSVTVILYNDTISINNASANVVTTGYEDAKDYALAGTCMNGSVSSVAITSVTGVDIDNTEPTKPSSQTPADGTKDTDGKVIFTATVNDATTTGCSLVFSSAGKIHTGQSMTYSGTTCTATVSLPNAVGEPYEWYVSATDGTNYTAGTTTTLIVDSSSNAGAIAALVNQQQETGSSKLSPGMVIAALILAFLVFQKRKKSKR